MAGRPPRAPAGTLSVAMLIQGYYPRIGGAERQLTALAPALQAQGVNVHVVTRRFAGLSPFETIDDVPVYRLPSPGFKASRSLAFTLAALPLLRKLRPDVIHAHDLYSPSTTALLAKRLLGTPVVVKIPRGGRLGDIARVRRRAFGRRRIAWLREGVDRFVVISREIDRELDAIGVDEGRRVAIPNGVDTERFAAVPGDRRAALRRQLELPEAPVVVYTGRLDPEKRLKDLVSVWPAVRKQHPGAVLVLVGSGGQSRTLAQVAGEGVRLIGETLDVAPFLRAADLFVLPSAAEGLSNSLLEAMSTGLTCVATTVGGAPELIEHTRSGWLVPPEEPAVLKQAILTLLAEPERRAAIGGQARARVEAGYSLPAIAARFPELYRQIVKGTRRAGRDDSA